MKNIKRNGIPYRRKREGRTDYHRRLALLKGRRPRLVVRRSLKNLQIQLVEFKPDGDKVISSTTSKELKKQGLKGSSKNIPAAYLTGILAGTKLKTINVTEVVPDLGLRKPQPKGVVFAVLKGLVDSGVSISHEGSSGESIFPPEERLKGEHIKNKESYDQIKAKIMK